LSIQKDIIPVTNITRREMLNLALASPLLAALPPVSLPLPEKSNGLDLRLIKNAPSAVVPVADTDTAKQVKLVREWRGPLCRSRLINNGRHPARVKEVVLFDLPLPLPPATSLYGEGFQMLSQTGGTLGQAIDLGNYTDGKHYKMPMPADARCFYGMMSLSPPAGEHYLLAFTSCRRFIGQFYLRASTLQIVVDTEGLDLKAGETLELEEFMFTSGAHRGQLLDQLAGRLIENHHPLRSKTPPAGWCSWYCFGPSVTATQVLDNLDFIAKTSPGLKYIQIDDGYQPAMGDWLETGAAFGGNVQGVLKEIRKRGFEPAIWVAPFIAEAKSHVFEQHPDWFVKDAAGKPLRSDLVTFGGWRRGPWYALDGTHPEAQEHLEVVFRTMRREWGCTYFKLDGNFWGAIHGGRFNDPRATRIEAYRRGMEAILRGAGDSFVLGCNHPIWPSLGLIHGSRSSNDIKRSWDRFETTARQNLSRNWQNGRLWWNDPDAVVLTGDLSDDEFRFHATAIYASGGMVLSGDDLTQISPQRLAMLKRLLPPTGVAASFEDDSMRVGVVKLADARMVALFNWKDEPQTLPFSLPEASYITDYWTGESLGRHKGGFTIKDMPAHSARLLVCKR
ncbi:MAG TPA: glycoside hydrolase family 36 protein, partial [Blastocatellia bacterium]|nr:glycoside hydrolase family 36 protein [Blastocatellia bacterium]